MWGRHSRIARWLEDGTGGRSEHDALSQPLELAWPPHPSSSRELSIDVERRDETFSAHG